METEDIHQIKEDTGRIMGKLHWVETEGCYCFEQDEKFKGSFNIQEQWYILKTALELSQKTNGKPGIFEFNKKKEIKGMEDTITEAQEYEKPEKKQEDNGWDLEDPDRFITRM